MKLKYKDMIKALTAIEDERNVPEEVILEALKEAMAKAYKKEVDLSDITVEAEINQRKGTIDIYQLYNVVEEENIEDDELEMSVEDAREIKSDAEVGDVVKREVEITTMSRAAATLARNVIRQKIREAEKVSVYNEYINDLNEMVLGIVESVKDKFALINLGKTVAIMPKNDQIPEERIVEGQKIRVVITDVKKETKGSQVCVSRASEMLVKRLFEKEVPEIYQGVVEIKAIARDAGERTKMAVVSHNPDIDPIGACIGQRGQRVQGIIEELHGEKIDIFEWSEDITQLVKNALSPAEVEAVIPNDDGTSLLVIVRDDQLSLAIGRKGKNARLANKLCNKKVDIKTRSELEAQGKDYDALMAKAAEQHAEYEKELAKKAEERKLAEAKADEEKRKAAVAELMKNRSDEEIVEEDIMPEEMKEVVKDKIRTEMAFKEDDHEEEPVEEVVTETVNTEELTVEEEPVAEEAVVEESVVETAKPKRKKADLEAIAQKNDYVSAFEKFADTSKPKQNDKPKRKKRKSDEDDIKVRNKDLESQIRKDLDTSNVKPIYTEEELEEIERQEMLEEESQYDIDYDEYEDYYNEEDN